jgi:hypothetical protein
MRYLPFLFILLFIVSCGENAREHTLSDFDTSSSQFFTIKPGRDTLIEGEKGTRIKFQKNSFVTNEGELVKEEVQIFLREFYTVADFISNRLSTVTVDGDILRSSGMIFIQATSGGKELKIMEDKPMTLMFQRVQDSPTANLFSGEMGSNNEIRWRSLESVHNDTLVLVSTTIFHLSYGRDSIILDVKILVGTDTLEREEVNSRQIDKIINRELALMIDQPGDDSVEINSIDQMYVFDSERLYIFETPTLGLINCDFFIEEELYPFTVKLEDDNSEIYVVLDNLNSVITPVFISKDANEYRFSVPKDIPISVVAYRKVGDTHYYTIERMKSGSKIMNIKLKEAPLSKIREEIMKLE